MRPTGSANWIAVSLRLGTILAPLAAMMVAIMALAPDAPRPVAERVTPGREARDAARAAAPPSVPGPSAARGI